MQRVDIADADEVYRRIVSFHVRRDGSISSAAFKVSKQPEQDMSVDLARLTSGPEETQVRAGRPGFGVIALVAGGVRQIGLRVEHRPLPENSAHSQIEGRNDEERCVLLAERSRILIHPAPRAGAPGS